MKKAFLLHLLFFLSIPVLAQEETGGRKGKFFLIPEIWLSFGSSTYIDISPMVGYHVFERLAVGLGPHYIYQSYKTNPNTPPPSSTHSSTHSYGVKGFARFSLITNAENFFP